MTREEQEAAISTLEYIKEYCHYEYEKETIDKVQEALNQEPILDKIRAEIEDLDRFYDNDYFSTNNCPMYKCNEVLQIIDKYKAESEE